MGSGLAHSKAPSRNRQPGLSWFRGPIDLEYRSWLHCRELDHVRIERRDAGFTRRGGYAIAVDGRAIKRKDGRERIWKTEKNACAFVLRTWRAEERERLANAS